MSRFCPEILWENVITEPPFTPSKKGLVHAGFRDAPREKDVICETAAIGIGYWDGKKIVDTRESAVAESMRTGDVVVKNY